MINSSLADLITIKLPLCKHNYDLNVVALCMQQSQKINLLWTLCHQQKLPLPQVDCCSELGRENILHEFHLYHFIVALNKFKKKKKKKQLMGKTPQYHNDIMAPLLVHIRKIPLRYFVSLLVVGKNVWRHIKMVTCYLSVRTLAASCLINNSQEICL